MYAVLQGDDIISQWYPTKEQAIAEAKSLAKWHCGKEGFNNRDQDGCHIVKRTGVYVWEIPHVFELGHQVMKWDGYPKR